MRDDLIETTEFDAAFAAGAASVAASTCDYGEGRSIPYAIVPDGFQVKTLEHTMEEPPRIKASPKFESVDSFCTYIKRFGGTETQLFANRGANLIRAILDYHAPDHPSWATHTATLQLRVSDRWQIWKSKNNQRLSQVEFAEFLEDNLPDIVEPDGAVLQSVAEHLEAKKTVLFKSGLNLTNGAVQFSYQEAVEEKGKGQITVPTRFILGLPPYEHSPLTRIDVRLRYRIQDEKLYFIYLMDRPQDIVRAAFDGVVETVEANTQMPVLFGEL